MGKTAQIRAGTTPENRAGLTLLKNRAGLLLLTHNLSKHRLQTTVTHTHNNRTTMLHIPTSQILPAHSLTQILTLHISH